MQDHSRRLSVKTNSAKQYPMAFVDLGAQMITAYERDKRFFFDLLKSYREGFRQLANQVDVIRFEAPTAGTASVGARFLADLADETGVIYQTTDAASLLKHGMGGAVATKSGIFSTKFDGFPEERFVEMYGPKGGLLKDRRSAIALSRLPENVWDTRNYRRFVERQDRRARRADAEYRSGNWTMEEAAQYSKTGKRFKSFRRPGFEEGQSMGWTDPMLDPVKALNFLDAPEPNFFLETKNKTSKGVVIATMPKIPVVIRTKTYHLSMAALYEPGAYSVDAFEKVIGLHQNGHSNIYRQAWVSLQKTAFDLEGYKISPGSYERQQERFDKTVENVQWLYAQLLPFRKV